MTTPLVTTPEAQQWATDDDVMISTPQTEPRPTESPLTESPLTETLSRPFRLGLVGSGAAVGLIVRLLAANEFADLGGRSVMIGAAITSGLMGLGLLLMASERDRFGPPLAWISAITALAWGALNWISPPFAVSVTVWSKPDQAVLAAVGLGNGLLLAGIIALAFVRRHPTLSVGATMVGSVFALASNTIVLRDEWPAIILLGISFALILLAWDRSPRRELAYTKPDASPRVSRAALSFVSVALCGTALQLWTSRTEIPRSIPAVIVCILLVLGAFVTLVGVRREIEQRETTLSEWTSWAREIRTNDFRAEMENFESTSPAPTTSDTRPAVGIDGEEPRKLSFPNLSIPDGPETAASAIVPDTPPPLEGPPAPGLSLIPDIAPLGETQDATIPRILIPDRAAQEPVTAASADPITISADSAPRSIATPQSATVAIPRIDNGAVEAAPSIVAVPAARQPVVAGGAFSASLASTEPENVGVNIADLDALAAWISSPVAAARTKPLLVAIEAMSLDEFESLPLADAAMATEEIGGFLADVMPDADLVSWIDGPYFIVAYTSKVDGELAGLNKQVRKSLKGTDGTLAFLRPAADAILDDIVNEAVVGLLHARHAQDRASGR